MIRSCHTSAVLCLALLICLVLLPRRLREGIPIAIPIDVIVLGFVRLVLIGVTIVLLMATFRQLGGDGSVIARSRSSLLH